MHILTAHQEFIFDCQVRKLTAKTIKGYTNTPKQFFTFISSTFGVVNIEDVTTRQVKEYIKELLSRGYK